MQVCNLLTSSGLKSEVHFLNSHKDTENAGSFSKRHGMPRSSSARGYPEGCDERIDTVFTY